jgi:hypothetical protein
VAEVEVEPTGGDQTFWVTDSPKAAGAIIDALSTTAWRPNWWPRPAG